MSASGLELRRMNGQLAVGSTSGLPFPALGARVEKGVSKNRLSASARSWPSPDAVIGFLPCGQQIQRVLAACLCVGGGSDNGFFVSESAVCLCIKIEWVVFAIS